MRLTQEEISDLHAKARDLELATAFRITGTNGLAIVSRSDSGDWWVHHPAAGPQGFTIRDDREAALQTAQDLTDYCA